MRFNYLQLSACSPKSQLAAMDADPVPTDPIVAPSALLDLRRRRRTRETIIQGFLFLCGFLSIFITFGIIYELGKESFLFFGNQQWSSTNKPLAAAIDAQQTVFEVGTQGSVIAEEHVYRIENEVVYLESVDGTTVTAQRGYQGTRAAAHGQGLTLQNELRPTLLEFFTGSEWAPQNGKFGILPLLTATLIVSGVGILVAVPLGLATAIYLSEYASTRTRNRLKPILEILAGVPTVVYGFFALTFMTPFLRSLLGADVVNIYNMASAGIVIGILILPFVSTVSEDALNAVPRSLREAAFALGATRLETSIRVVVPAAFSGISAAVILAASRAIGETMIVAIASGAGPNLTFNPFQAAETMTGHIVRISGGDLSYNSVDYNSLFAVGLMLFVITLALNILSNRIVRRFREVYE
ncbi:MAG: phosphate ABC transporter permease subunit PstC [Anaerolineales bacterium]